MTGRILTLAEWAALVAAEEPMYRGNPGASPVTSCIYLEDSADLAGMWDTACPGVEMLIGYDDEVPDEAAAVKLVAHRVAAAQHYLVFGELPRAPRGEATCQCGQWPISEYGPVCPSCSKAVPA